MSNIQFYSGAIDAGECVSGGWNLVKPNYWMYFGITLLAVLLISCIPCVNFFLIGPVGVGVYYVLLKGMRSEPVDFGMMFKGFEKFVPAMVVGLIQGLPGIIWTVIDYGVNIASLIGGSGNGGSFGNFYQAEIFEAPFLAGFTFAYVILGIIFAVVSVVWGLTFVFALPILAEHDLGPIEALTLSARAAWSNIGGLILLVLIQIFLAILGVMALCIGVFFVIPVLYAANAFAYRQVFSLVEQRFNMSPPPPNAYGNFGSGM
ncbi:hypothetical protein BH20ACI2_BH20ACI2_24180 [soil metagenome]